MRLTRIIKDETLASAKKVGIVGDVGRYWKRGEDYAGIVNRKDKYYYVDRLYNILAAYDEFTNVTIIYPNARNGIEKLKDDSRVQWTRVYDSRLVKDSGYRIGRNRKLKDNNEKPNKLSIDEPDDYFSQGWGYVKWKTDKDGWVVIGSANKKKLEFSADFSHCPQEAIDYFSKNGWKINNTHVGPAEMDIKYWEYNEFDVSWRGMGDVATGDPEIKELYPYKDCPQEVIDYFIKLGYEIDKGCHLDDSIDNALSIHEMAALAFYLSYDMGFHFDELFDYYPGEEDVDTAYYKDIRNHERNNDRAFFNDVMKAYYPSKEDYEDILEDAVRDYEAYSVLL